MSKKLSIELYGPLSEDSGIKLVTGTTVGVIGESGQLRLLTITGIGGETPQGTVLYASGGEQLLLSDCYLLYTSDAQSVGNFTSGTTDSTTPEPD